MRKKKMIAYMMLSILLVNIMQMTVLADDVDSGSVVVNGITYEYILYGASGYAQANTYASSGSVQNIAMWGVLRSIEGSVAYNFSAADCAQSSDYEGHYRIHICASCNGYRVQSANSTHYFAGRSARLSITV